MEKHEGLPGEAMEAGGISREPELPASIAPVQKAAQLALWNSMAKRPDYVTVADSQRQAL